MSLFLLLYSILLLNILCLYFHKQKLNSCIVNCLQQTKRITTKSSIILFFFFNFWSFLEELYKINEVVSVWFQPSLCSEAAQFSEWCTFQGLYLMKILTILQGQYSQEQFYCIPLPKPCPVQRQVVYSSCINMPDVSKCRQGERVFLNMEQQFS